MKTKAILLCSVLMLASCGFEPMYGTTRFNAPTAQSAALEAILANIAIDNIPNREGQYLRNLLIDRFYTKGKPEAPAYTLNISGLKESKYDLDITKESDATRTQLKIEINMSLVDAAGKTILNRKLKALGSYNILTSEFTTRVSEQNTRENVLKDLAAQIETQIGLYAQSRAAQ